MSRFIPLALVALMALPLSANAETYRDRSVPMTVAPNFDLNRYLGLWYEIARFPFSFEKGCAGVTAEYALREDGKVNVLNTCHEGTPDGPVRVSEGSATVEGNAQLSVGFVSFLPFIAGDYWVLHVEPDYSMAVVGAPKGSTGWILSRDKTLSAAKYERALQVLRDNGYDASRLEIVAH